MVEAAIFAPIIIMLVMGTIMGGLYFGDTIAIKWASRSGARAGSVGGNDGFADYDILQAVKGAMIVLPDNNIDYVVVYRTNDFGGQPSSTCASGTPVTGLGVGDCNVYTAADFKRESSEFGASGWYGDDSWLATKRGVSGISGTDYLGVWIKARCTCGADIFGSDGTIISSSVVRLEAKEA